MKNLLIIISLFIQLFFVSSVKAELLDPFAINLGGLNDIAKKVTIENFSQGSSAGILAPISYNKFFLTEKNYGIIGNKIASSQTIRIGTNKYCKERLGKNYNATHDWLNSSVAFFYCSKADEYLDYDLTITEKSCVKNLELKLIELYAEECSTEDRIKLNNVIKEVEIYRSKIKYLESNSFMISLLTDEIYNAITNYELEVKYNKISKMAISDLENKVSQLKNPIYKEMLQLTKKIELELQLNSQSEELENLIITKNIKTCKKYKFVEGSDSYFQCLLKLIEKVRFIGM